MLGLFLGIAAIIATGIIIAHIAKLTIQWLIGKVKNMFAKNRVQKVSAIKLEKLIEECPNQMSLEELESKGVDAIIASVDAYGNIEDVEAVAADTVDSDFNQKLGYEGMIVINR